MEKYIAGKAVFVGTFQTRGLFEFEPSTHEHQYNRKGECPCGKVLPDIKPYPIVGGAQPWMR
jgi:hypothetical protein